MKIRFPFYILFALLIIKPDCRGDDSIPFQEYQGDAFVSDSGVSRVDRGFYNYQVYLSPDTANPLTKFYINTCFGNLINQRTDFSTNDISTPVNLFFTYNSGSYFSARYGNKWQMSYNIRYVTNNKNNNVLIQMPDDKTILFVFDRMDSSYRSSPAEPGYYLVKLPVGFKLKIIKDNLLNSGNFSEYYFDSTQFNYITKIINRNNDTIRFKYQVNNNLVKIVFPSGRYLSFFYNSDNFLNSVKYNDSTVAGYEYPDGNSLKIIYPDSSTIIYKFDECGFLTNFNASGGYYYSFNKNGLGQYIQLNADKDTLRLNYSKNPTICYADFFNGFTEQFTYDTNNRILSVQPDSLAATTYIWNVSNQQTGMKIGERQSAFEYDRFGLPSKISYPDNTISYYSRDTVLGLLILKVDQNGDSTIYQRDNYGNLISIVDGNGNSSLFDYGLSGQLTGYKLREGNKFVIDWDDFGNISSISLGNTNNYTIQHDLFNRISQVNGPTGNVYDIEHDNAFIRLITGNGFIKSYQPDLFGNNLRFDDNTIFYDYSYDNIGRLKQISKNPHQLYSADYGKNDVILHNFNEDSIRIELNSTGKIIGISGDNFSRFYKLNAYNEITSELLNGSQFESYGYDNLSRLTNKSRNGIQADVYGYDKAGNLNFLQNSAGLEYNFKYDKSGCLINIYSNTGYNFKLDRDDFNEPQKLTVNGSMNYYFEYDYAERLIETSIPDGNTVFRRYDIQGNLKSRSDSIGNVFYYDYDSENHPIAIHNPDGGVLNIIRQGDGNIQSFKDETGNKIFISKPTAEKISITYPNGSTKNISFDSEKKINKIEDNIGNFLSMDYDVFGRLSVLNSNGLSTNFNYLFGKVTESINNTGNFIRFVNDKSFRLNRIISSDADDFNIYYSSSFQPQGFITGSGNEFKINLDPAARLIDFTNNENQQTVYSYDNFDRIIRTIRTNGNTISYYYNNIDGLNYLNCNEDTIFFNLNDNGNLDYLKNMYGKEFKLNYDYRNQITLFISGDKSTSFNYNLSGYLLEKNFNNQYTIKSEYWENNLSKLYLNKLFEFDFFYSNSSLPTSISLNTKNLLSFQYKKNLPVKIKDAGGTGLDLTYNDAENLIIIKREDNTLDQFTYNNIGRLSAINFTNGIIYTYKYDLNGLLNAINFSDGNSVHLDYNSSGNLISIFPGPFDVVTMKYDNWGKMIEYQNENGEKLKISRNWLGSPVSITYPEKNSIDLRYSPSDSSLSANLPDNKFYKYRFDSFNRLIGIISPEGFKTQNHYDICGNLIEQDNSTLIGFSSEFSDNVILKKSLSPADSTFIDYDADRIILNRLNWNTLQINANYDNRERISLLDLNGKKVSFFYNSLGNLARISDQTKGDSYYSLKGGLFPESINENKFLPKSFTYNSLFDINSMKYNDRTLQLTYNNRNNIKELSVKNFLQMQFFYDKALNPILLYPITGIDEGLFWSHFSRLDSINISSKISSLFLYDDNNFVTKGINSSGYTVKVDRNDDNLPVDYEFTNNLDFDFKIGVSYNDNRQISKLTIPGTTLTYDYKPGNILNIITGAGTYILNYNPEGFPLTIEYPNGYRAEYTYRYDRLPLSFVIRNMGLNKLIHSEYYSYDNINRLISIYTEQDSTLFLRDSTGKIVKRVINNDTTLMIYDIDGNLVRVEKNNIQSIRHFDLNSTLITLGDHNFYSYNISGEMVSKTDDSQIFQYDYDATGHLIKIKSSEDGSSNLVYDIFGNLLLVDNWEKNYYIHLPANPYGDQSPAIASLDGLGAINKYYDILPGSNGGMVLGEFEQGEANKFFYFVSPFGNSALIMDYEGNTIAENPSSQILNIDSSDKSTKQFLYFNQFVPYYPNARIYMAGNQPIEEDSKRAFSPDLANINNGFDLYCPNNFDFKNRMPKIGIPEKVNSSALKIDIDNFDFGYGLKDYLPLLESKDQIYRNLISGKISKQFNDFQNLNVSLGFTNDDEYLKTLDPDIFGFSRDVSNYFVNYGFSATSPKLEIKLPEWIWDPYISLILDETSAEHPYHATIKYNSVNELSELYEVFQNIDLPENNPVLKILTRLRNITKKSDEPIVFNNVMQIPSSKINPDLIPSFFTNYYDFNDIFKQNFSKRSVNDDVFKTIKLLNNLKLFNRDYNSDSSQFLLPYSGLFPSWSLKYNLWEKSEDYKIYDKIKSINRSNLDKILKIINTYDDNFLNLGKLFDNNDYIELPPIGNSSEWLNQMPILRKNDIFNLPYILNR